MKWEWNPFAASRKYPIRRDSEGRSLRQQAFELFDEKFRPSQIYKQQLLPAKLKTLLRYYEDWKRKGDHVSYRVTSRVMKENPDFTQQMITALSEKLGMPVDEVIKRMQKPWGLKQALRGHWPDYRLEREQSNVEARLQGGLRFMRMAGLFQNSPKELAELLLQITILKENAKLEITRQGRHLVCKKEEEGKVTTLELDYGHENN
jgi:hypothetical protein